MKYISEMNAFRDWRFMNKLSKSAIALWYALMQINNLANWAEEFSVAMSVLEYDTGFSRSDLYRARNELQQKGRISWKEQGGRSCAIYHIIPLCVPPADTNCYTTATQTATQTATINRQEKIRQEERGEVRAKNPTQPEPRTKNPHPPPNFDSVSISNSEIRRPDSLIERRDSLIEYWNSMVGTEDDPGHVVQCPIALRGDKEQGIYDFLNSHDENQVIAFLDKIHDSVFLHQRASEGWKPNIFWAIERADEIIAGNWSKNFKAK